MTKDEFKNACKDAGVTKSGEALYLDILKAIETVVQKHGAGPEVGHLFKMAVREIEGSNGLFAKQKKR